MEAPGHLVETALEYGVTEVDPCGEIEWFM